MTGKEKMPGLLQTNLQQRKSYKFTKCVNTDSSVVLFITNDILTRLGHAL